jgi:protein-disulfide isomerase
MSTLTVPVRRQDHVRGPANAPVTLVEYGDFECPFCGRAYYVLKEIENEVGPQLRVAFRYFPLTSIHPHAEAAALAAEAAGVQEKFWEMHDLLFENQDSLEDEDLLEYAESLELDMVEFQDALRTGRVLPRVKEDFMSGVRSGVNGTPTFFINGARHDATFENPVLLRAIQRAAQLSHAR